jgi:hypothetical protein
MKSLIITIITLTLALTANAQTEPLQFRLILDNGYFSVTNAKTGQRLGGVSLEKWKRIATYTDNRHAALDVTAGVVAGRGSREHTVNPNSPVYTVADYKSGKALAPTGTEERGRYFVIMSDTKVHGRYEAIVLEPRSIARAAPAEMSQGRESDFVKDSTLPSAAVQRPSDISVGSIHDIVHSVELRDGPGETYEKKINQKASDTLRRIWYMSVDSDTTVKVLDVKGEWVQVQVIEPDWLADTHRGWIPVSALKGGKATHKRNGWISHTCFVYSGKNANSKRTGYLSQRSAVHVVDDESGWLELPAWDIAKPVMDLTTNDFLDEAQKKRTMYIEASNFTETPPGNWGR